MGVTEPYTRKRALRCTLVSRIGNGGKEDNKHNTAVRVHVQLDILSTGCRLNCEEMSRVRPQLYFRENF